MINIDQVQTELGAFFRANNKEVVSMIYRDDVDLNPHCRTITKVKGKFPAIHSVTSHVIQGFRAVWDEMGDTTFKVNELTAYHQKVNFPVYPYQVENSWLAETNEENKDLKDKTISRHIFENELKPVVVQDLQYLVGNGVYDAGRLQEFGYSMNGIKEILRLGLTNADNPMFKIQLDALTESNMVEQITKFERSIPSKIRKFIKKIFLSTNRAEDYAIDYENQFGANTLVKEGDFFKTRLGKRTLIGLDCLNGSNYIFATVDRNLLKLIDMFDMPTVTDIQKEDYKLKVFMEFWLGYGFWTNQMVLTADYTGGATGLGSGEFNALYYPNEGLDESGS